MTIIKKNVNRCIKCGNGEIETKDCGYNTFNPGSSKCTSCGNEVKVSDCESLNPDPYLKRVWNSANPKPAALIKRIDKKIEDLKLEKRRVKNLFEKDLK